MGYWFLPVLEKTILCIKFYLHRAYFFDLLNTIKDTKVEIMFDASI